MPDIRAVIFDIGGVLTTSPVTAIRTYAESNGVDWYALGPMLAEENLAWSRWERSEITNDEFLDHCQREMAERRIHGITSAGIQQAAFGGQAVRIEMISVVRALQGRVRLGCITNNVLRDDSRPASLFALDELFEVVIESAKVGLRKPDPRIFQMACDGLGVSPPESAFLDDLGINLKGARALGMTTIKVDHTHSAIDALEAALGFELPRA